MRQITRERQRRKSSHRFSEVRRMSAVMKFQTAHGRRGSVLECGSPLPLFTWLRRDSQFRQSARGLAQSKTWRISLALLCILVTQATSKAAETQSLFNGKD